MAHITSLIRRADRYRRVDAPLKLLTYVWTEPPRVIGGSNSSAPWSAQGLGRPQGFPGCLKSESEERETWTAESLRTASSNGEGISLRAWAFSRKRAVMEETWRSTFKGTSHRSFEFSGASPKANSVGVVDLVKTCDLPESISSNLRV